MKLIVLTTIFLVCIGAGSARGDYLDPFRAEEVRLLKTHGSAIRNGGELRITTEVGPVQFSDNNIDGEAHVRFALTAAFRLAHGRVDFVVRGFGWESHSFTVVNGRTGKKLEATGMPILSPDKKHYLAATLDLDAGYETNALAIYRTEDFERVSSIIWYDQNGQPPVGPAGAVWKSSTEVTFNETTQMQNGRRSVVPRVVKYKNGKWVGPPGRPLPESF